jgi:hypothetical protein
MGKQWQGRYKYSFETKNTKDSWNYAYNLIKPIVENLYLKPIALA